MARGGRKVPVREAAPVVLPVANSSAFLSADGAVRRLPRNALRGRPAAFKEQFEDLALFYDCFWHADGKRILLVGPPPMNLGFEARYAKYRSMPLDTWLGVRVHASPSIAITELFDVPQHTTDVAVDFAGQEFVLPVRPNLSVALRDRRVLFSMNKDNDLNWIREWANWHVRMHAADAVILFDNGSTRYGTDEIVETLCGVQGLSAIAVPDWPYKFGRTDPAVLFDPDWAHFLKIASMSVALRRFGMAAEALLNCSIDELAGTRSGRSIFDHAALANRGLASFGGRWIEADPEPGAVAGAGHSAYRKRLADPDKARSRQRAWVLDPKQSWLESLSVHPYPRRIAGRPLFSEATPADAFYWRFKALNAAWGSKPVKSVPPGALEPDPDLATAFARVAANG